MAFRPSIRSTPRLAAVVLGAGLAVGALAGCGDSAGGSGQVAQGAGHVMPDGTTMSDAEMQSMPGMSGTGSSDGDSAVPASPGAQDAADADQRAAPGRVAHFTDGPSSAAAMICSRGVADAVRRNFALPSEPMANDTWKPPAYTCDYALTHGTLHLGVRDLRTGAKATAWFRGVQDGTAGAHRIQGLQALGLPAFEAPAGQVGFLKDGRTLVVDASDVAKQDLPPGFSRTGVAYGVAASVIACWTE
jgi:hypothetical protein